MNINNDFEEYLLNLVSVNEVELYRIIKYQLGWEDEGGNKIENLNPKNRKFSNLTLKISKIFGDDLSKSFPFAASIEILASSWYVHGDVQSGITDRLADLQFGGSGDQLKVLIQVTGCMHLPGFLYLKVTLYLMRHY